MEEVIFLLFTIAIETPVAIAFLQRPWRKIAMAAVCVSMVTHPIAWELSVRGISFYAIEVGVITVEMLLFMLVFPERKRKAALAAACMNIVSALVGVLFF
jgi:hypothetical protein